MPEMTIVAPAEAPTLLTDAGVVDAPTEQPALKPAVADALMALTSEEVLRDPEAALAKLDAAAAQDQSPATIGVVNVGGDATAVSVEANGAADVLLTSETAAIVNRYRTAEDPAVREGDTVTAAELAACREADEKAGY